ncbi:MAG: SUMF1/EgtB/PvdO family nonheme iron enzyme [Verrucomicrobia bacterium]|jgi:formylglycine-generating enzyme required for sulfatase activity|nr:SUMF1/EgtB/PvdO family nonheme iron enzyme [Verrucomicrobiota bacterium]MBT7700664.1 SUMF1/EgtB/PvdO family nonheme iron enzyme [Verrucomicrobiota bacterium]
MKLHMILTVLVVMVFSVSVRATDDSRGMKVVYGEARTALVIGNSTYAANPLVNPMNDAADVANLLRQRKFNVRLLANADKKSMDAAIEEFGQRLEQGGVGLFYYAGHAVQVEGVNYLLPVDAHVRKAHDLKYQGINVQQVLSEMATSRNRLNVVILDACRDNPFPALSRSLGSGLAKVDAPRGSLIAYATAPGKTAADGSGRNGVFTKHLLQQASVPGKDVLDMFRDVTAGVARDTKEQQEPWVHTSVRGKFYFTPIDFLDQELELTAAELARYRRLMAEQQAADDQLQQLEAEKNAAIGQMEKEIADLRHKMNESGHSGDSLDQLVALADRREHYAEDLVAAKAKADQEKKARETEMARLRDQEKANRKTKFETAYAKYCRIAGSEYMRDTEKRQAWNLICQAWNVTEATDAPGVLGWDDRVANAICMFAGPVPGQDMVIDLGRGVKMELVCIEPDSFMMGALESPSEVVQKGGGEEEPYKGEHPRHGVKLSQGFWMGKYEVTQGQWLQVMGSYPGDSLSPRIPVTEVSWDDCQVFLSRLNARSANGMFRLPTEAEWEYACRAGTSSAFHYGGNLDPWMANFDGNHPYGLEREGEHDAEVRSVGLFKPNAWGLYDMHGNVLEWCQDWYGSYPSEGVEDPTGAASGDYRIIRGGSWFHAARECRSACRSLADPTERSRDWGFRVVLSPNTFRAPDTASDRLKLETWTSRGVDDLILEDGDELKLSVRVNQPCYLRIIQRLPSGARALPDKLLWGNYYMGQDRINKVVKLPSTFVCRPPFGKHVLQTFVSTAKFPAVSTTGVKAGTSSHTYSMLQDGADTSPNNGRSKGGLRIKKGVDVAECLIGITIIAKQ